jgi:DNA repair protein RadA/Sms
MATGMDHNRMVLLMAILEKRLGIDLSSYDAYINVVGGIRIDEPALDLAVIAVLYSSLREFEIPDDLMVLGEVGLTGEVRSISQMEKRLIEGAKLGFKRCIIPKGNLRGLSVKDMELMAVDNVRSALEIIS